MLEQLAEICTGITREEMAQPVFSGLSVLNYPELHEESISQLNSFRAVSKMMEICGIQDFSMKDFMAPSAKRLRRQLSGIINFAKFREERLVLLSDLNSTREVVLERMNKLKDQNLSKLNIKQINNVIKKIDQKMNLYWKVNFDPHDKDDTYMMLIESSKDEFIDAYGEEVNGFNGEDIKFYYIINNKLYCISCCN
jgi:hypothetical protein